METVFTFILTGDPNEPARVQFRGSIPEANIDGVLDIDGALTLTHAIGEIAMQLDKAGHLRLTPVGEVPAPSGLD